MKQKWNDISPKILLFQRLKTNFPAIIEDFFIIEDFLKKLNVSEIRVKIFFKNSQILTQKLTYNTRDCVDFDNFWNSKSA